MEPDGGTTARAGRNQGELSVVALEKSLGGFTPPSNNGHASYELSPFPKL
jgi:hypothetical protein